MLFHEIFSNVIDAQAAPAHRGGYPYNMATLDGPYILAKATDKVQKEGANVPCSRGIDATLSQPIQF